MDNRLNNSSDFERNTPGIRYSNQDDSTVFSATFIDAITLKSIVGYLQSTNKEGNFTFGYDSIKYTQVIEKDSDGNISSQILNEMFIDPSWLVDYEYISEYPEYTVRIKLDKLKALLADIKGKCGVTIYKVEEDTTIFLQISGSESGIDNQSNIGHMQPTPFSSCDESSIDVYDFPPESRPTCTISSESFSRACTSFTRIDSTQIDVCGYANGFTIVAKVSAGEPGKVFRFGKVTDKELSESVHGSDHFDNNEFGIVIVDSDDEEIGMSNPKPMVSIGKKTLKSLAKVRNLASDQTIKFFMAPGLPIKIVASVGNYGVIRIYVRDAE